MLYTFRVGTVLARFCPRVKTDARAFGHPTTVAFNRVPIAAATVSILCLDLELADHVAEIGVILAHELGERRRCEKCRPRSGSHDALHERLVLEQALDVAGVDIEDVPRQLRGSEQRGPARCTHAREAQFRERRPIRTP